MADLSRLAATVRKDGIKSTQRVYRDSLRQAQRFGRYAWKERARALTLGSWYLAISGLFVFGLQASTLDAPTLVFQEYNESFLTRADGKSAPFKNEAGVRAYLGRNMKGASPAKIAKLSRHIISLSERFNFHPGLILSVMKVESGFRAWAVSPRGALGLMQVMPETGQWIAHRYGMKWEGPEMLLDEEINIIMGVRYLDYLRSKYDGDLRKMLSAYNRGPGTVDMELAEGRDGELKYYYKVKEHLPKLALLTKKNQNVHVD